MAEEPGPEHYAYLVRVLIYLTPFGAALSFVLAAVQGAGLGLCLLLAGVTAFGCLAAALLIHLRGSKAAGDAGWIAIILALIARR